MDGHSHGLADRPLVPHVALGHVSPEVKFQFLLLLHLDRVFEREEDGEPGEHPGGVGGGKDGDHDLFVQEALEVASESVEDRVCLDVEAELFVSRVVNHFGHVGMLKCKQGLGRGKLKTILNRKNIFKSHLPFMA